MKKIALNKETLRKLDENELGKVNGGKPTVPCKYTITPVIFTENTCPGDSCRHC